MKNVTLKIDDETYRKARILAARRETSLSAMVREYLEAETRREEDESKRVEALEKLYREADERAKRRPPRTEPLTPLKREEIYAERLP